MDEITITEEAYELGVTNPVGCLIDGLDVRNESRALDVDVKTTEDMLRNDINKILNKDEVQGARDLYEAMGYPDTIPDGEKRIELIRDRGLNRHNNVVDAYNIAGAEYGVGLGMHDVAQLSGDVVVDCADGYEEIVPLFRESPRSANAGDLMYGTDDDVLWISGTIGRDADQYKVTEDTETALLMAVGNPETSTEYNEKACRRAFELIKKTNPDATIELLDVRELVVA